MTESQSPATLPLLDADQLIPLSQQPTTPFKLETDQGIVVCQDILRFLPGKRLVARAVQNKRQVIIKCFYGKGARRYFQRELAGINGFIHAEIDTPDLLATSTDTQGMLTITTEDLGKVESLAELWKKATINDERRKTLLKKSAGLLAKLHCHGVCQEDIHLDNLLVCNERLCMIDGGGASVSTKPLSQRRSRKNLALFMAVLFPRYDRFAEAVLSSYAEGNPVAAHWDKNEFLKTVCEQRKWRERFIRKSLRNCTAFRVESSRRHFYALSRQYDGTALQALIADPEACIANGQILKLGRTNTVAIATLNNGQKVLIKKYQSTKGFLHKYLRTLRSSRARKSWLNGHLLQFLGIDTPAPMAMVEHKTGPAITCSYIVTEYISGTHAMAYFDASQEALPEWPQVASAIGDILITLKRSTVYHGDLKGNNFLIRNNKPLLIDLDAMTSYKWRFCFQRLFRKDLERFGRNWKDNPRAEALLGPAIKAWEQA